MAKDPLDRSSAATLLQHPFVASLTTPDEGTVPVESMISEIQSIGPALLHYRELEKLWNSDSSLDQLYLMFVTGPVGNHGRLLVNEHELFNPFVF